MDTSNNSLKIQKANIEEPKGEINKSTIMIEDINICPQQLIELVYTKKQRYKRSEQHNQPTRSN